MNISFKKIEFNDYIKSKYKKIYDFKENFAVVIKEIDGKDKYGYIDLKGKEVIDCKYEVAHNFSEGLALVKDEKGYLFIENSGKIFNRCPDEYELCGSFHNELSVVKNKSNLYGYINKNMCEVIPCKYEAAYQFNEGLALVKKDSLKFYIDNNGTTRIYPKKDVEYIDKFNNGIVIIKTNDIYCYMDKEGRIYNELYQIEELRDLYLAKVPSYLLYHPSISEKDLIIYCSDVIFLGQKITLKAESIKELTEMKKELLFDIKEGLKLFANENFANENYEDNIIKKNDQLTKKK